jgi:hypothetical protein
LAGVVDLHNFNIRCSYDKNSEALKVNNPAEDANIIKVGALIETERVKDEETASSANTTKSWL